MPLLNTTKERMVREIIRIVHECDVGMLFRAEVYRNAVERNAAPSDIFSIVKAAVRLPYRIEARVQARVTKHGASTVNAALALVSTYSLSDLNAELTPLKAYSDVLKNHYQNDGWTLDQLISDIEANASPLDEDESVLIPANYEDDM